MELDREFLCSLLPISARALSGRHSPLQLSILVAVLNSKVQSSVSFIYYSLGMIKLEPWKKRFIDKIYQIWWISSQRPVSLLPSFTSKVPCCCTFFYLIYLAFHVEIVKSGPSNFSIPPTCHLCSNQHWHRISSFCLKWSSTATPTILSNSSEFGNQMMALDSWMQLVNWLINTCPPLSIWLLRLFIQSIPRSISHSCWLHVPCFPKLGSKFLAQVHGK